MLLDDYSVEIQDLSSKLFQYNETFDKRAFTVLKKLENIAKSMDDHSFSGFVYFNYAGVYYDHNNHKKTFEYLKKAIYELLRSDERELIARAYNLFSLEAQSYGCFDVAYQYHKLAYTFIENEDNDFLKAIILSNGGDLFTDLENSKQAKKYFKSGLSLFKKCNIEDVKKQIALVNTNICLHNFYTKDYKRMAKDLNKAEEFIISNGLENDDTVQCWLLLLKTQMALYDLNDDLSSEYNNQLIESIISKAHFVFYAKDICRFAQLLIENKEWEKTGQIISAINPTHLENTSSYIKMLIKQLEISYYSTIGNKKKLFEVYGERDQLLSSNEKEMHMIHYESIQLEQIIEQLNNEQIKTMSENERLQVLSETDELTKIPNRNALNTAIEIAFENAYQNQYCFGVSIFDIDDFKNYNDLYGHLGGDECLKKVAHTLQTIAKKYNLVAYRYGGDEFVIIYEDFDDNDIYKIEEDLNKSIDVSIAHGFYNAIPNESSRPWDYFAKADEELYQKKVA